MNKIAPKIFHKSKLKKMNRKIFAIFVVALFALVFANFAFCQQDSVTSPTTQIKIVPINAGGIDFSLSALQKDPGFVVIIISSKPKAVQVAISGPVRGKQLSETTFEVTLELLGSEAAFNEWIKGKEAPYIASFTVQTKDVRGLLLASEVGVFTFGKW